jgi:hypothetical protein
MPPRKYLSELPVLPVRDWNFRWLAEEGVVLRENELPVLPVRDQNFQWGPEVSVGVYFESDFHISNRFVFRSVFGRGKLRK